MTALLVLFAILSVIAIAMFFLKRQEEKARTMLKSQKEQRRAISASRTHPLLSLKIGDIIEYVGQTFRVEGKLIFREDGFEWCEYKVADGDDVRWLEVEDDDELWVSLYKEVDIVFDGAPPDEIEFDGDEYELEEEGSATMRREGNVGSRTLPHMRYFDYEGSGGNVMSIEQWGDKYEVSVGISVSPNSIEIFGAGDE